MPTPNAGILEHAINACSKKLVVELPNIAEQTNPAQAKESLLPYFAQAEAVPYWNSNLSSDEKRQLIQEAPPFYDLAGTKSAIEKAMDLLDFSYELVPWCDTDELKPFTALLTINIYPNTR